MFTLEANYIMFMNWVELLEKFLEFVKGFRYLIGRRAQ